MLENILYIWDLLTTRGTSASVLLFILVLFARWLIVRFIDRHDHLSAELKLRWLGFIKTLSFLIIIIGLALIWAPQLRTLALSITAFAVAVVIATKELILCLSGSLIKTSSNTFSIGDLIQIKDFKGYVVSQNFWTTTLRELSNESLAPSGNDIILPNSLFVSDAVRNYSPLSPYSIHSFSVYFTARHDTISIAETILTDTLKQHWQTLQADEHFKSFMASKKLLLTRLEPNFRITTSKEARLCFTVTICCHGKDCLQIESDITKQLTQGVIPSKKNSTTTETKIDTQT